MLTTWQSPLWCSNGAGMVCTTWNRQFLFAKNNRSKPVCTLFQRKHLNNQTVWPVIFGLTGPICARALKSQHTFKLHSRGHQDWPVKLTNETHIGEDVANQLEGSVRWS